MWGGNVKLTTQKIFTMTSTKLDLKPIFTVYYEDILISERCMKIFDEAIVNTFDHKERTKKLNPPHRMTTVIINFDINTGVFAIFNDGDGFDVARHELHPEKLYVPQIITTENFRGSNYTKNDDSTTAGTNGVGIKLTAAHSLEFTLDTFDINRGLNYYQKSIDHMETVGAPTVLTCNEYLLKYGKMPTPHTMITVNVDYASLGWGYIDYKDINDKNANKTNKRFCNITHIDYMNIEKWLRMRAACLAVSLGCTTIFNGDVLPFDTLEKLTDIIWPGDKIHCRAKMYKGATKEELCDKKSIKQILEMRGNREIISEFEIIVVLGQMKTISLINGVVVYAGPHIDAIKNIIHNAAKHAAADLIADKYKDEMLGMFTVIIVATIPGIVWGSGQMKESMSDNKDRYNMIEIEPGKLKLIADLLYNELLLLRGRPKKNVKGITLRANRHTRAMKYGSTSTLMIAEGDSAKEGFLDYGRTNKDCQLGTELYGSYYIGGVPINARKCVDIRNIRGVIIPILNNKIDQNLTFNELLKIINLDINKKYETDAEFHELNYGQIWCFVDEDLDGRGCIFGLILNLFHLFWPALVKRGFIKRFRTPLVRLFPTDGCPNELKKNAAGQNMVREFYFEKDAFEFMKMAEEKYKKRVSSMYDVIYYKGLARQNKPDIRACFQKKQNNLITLMPDPNINKMLDLYYADETDIRKVEFSTPVADLNDLEVQLLNTHHIITSTTQLSVYTKEYKLDNLTRKLPGFDGLVVSRRRIIFGAIKKWASPGTKRMIRIFQFGGFVAEHAFYHHGEASLNQTITKMAQCIPGIQTMPFLLGEGDVGSMVSGGKKFGSPRYVDVSFNKELTNIVFNAADETLLKISIEDGERSIPVYYMPIVPIVLFKSEKIPADGWNYITWARDIPATVGAIRGLIVGIDKFSLPPCTDGLKCIIKTIGNSEISIGTYTLDGNILTITSLPIRVWSSSYIDAFKKFTEVRDANNPKKMKKSKEDKYADEYKEIFMGEFLNDESNDETVRIIFKLKPGGLEKIKESAAKSSIAFNVQKIIDKQDDSKIKGAAEAGHAGRDDADVEIEQNKTVQDFLVQNWHEMGDYIQQYFGLIVRMNKNLNMLDINGCVREYKTYEEVLKYWFPIRREYYIKRLSRQLIILKIQKKYMEETIRFCMEYVTIGMGAHNLTEDNMNDILTKNKYALFNFTNYNKLEHVYESDIPNDKLNEFAVDDPDYTYLLHLNSLNRSVESQKKYRNQLEKINNAIENINSDHVPFLGARQWLKELDEFEALYKRGFATRWRFGKNENLSYV